MSDSTVAKAMPRPDLGGLRGVSDLRLAVVCDEFTALGLAPECQAVFLEPCTWQEQIRQTKPHMLLVESSWYGPGRQWQGLVTHGGEVISRLARFCRQAGIPTVFWAKEDPVHFGDFVATAKLFDWVFTTDAESVTRYQENLRHDRVGVMTFSVQPRMHNPLVSTPRTSASFFAGAWYANFPQRCAEFNNLASGLLRAGPFHIYRREGPPDIGDYPAMFAESLHPGVDYIDIAELYRRYQVGLTINTVTTSSTMFARRAVEMLACGTAVYSNCCLALERLFPVVVEQFDQQDAIAQAALTEYRDPDSLARRVKRTLGVRTVLATHTWHHRLAHILEQVYGFSASSGMNVKVLAKVGSESEMERFVAFLDKQEGVDVQGYVWAGEAVIDCYGVHRLDANELSMTPAELFDDDVLLGFWSPQDWYGPHFLQDLCLAACLYAGDVVGKGAYYRGSGSKVMLCKHAETYSRGSSVPLRRAVARARVWSGTTMDAIDAAAAGRGAVGVHVSVDEFSYVEEGAHCAVPAWMNATLHA
jgi:spore maturation protein CgeB